MEKLPVYYALTIEKTAMLGGTTLPCLMVVGDKDGKIKGNYVVKVFGQKHIEQYNPTNKEIFANILADYLDIFVPKAALIYVDEELIEVLKSSPQYHKVELKAGYYFGSEYLENCLSYEQRHLWNYDKWLNIESIFAFDILIRNFDRRVGKPNILFGNEALVLIDHDLSLDIQKSFQDYAEFDSYKNVVDGVKGKHIFLDYLIDKNKTKAINFGSFVEYLLYYFDYDCLDSVVEQLHSLEFEIDDFFRIKSYLLEVKKYHLDFQEILKKLIT